MAKLVKDETITKRDSWESRAASALVRRRFLSLIVIMGLQVGLVLVMVALLWATQVQDTIVVSATASGTSETLLQAGETISADDLRVELGEPVVEEQNLLVAPAEMPAPTSGIAWGNALVVGETIEGAPQLALLGPSVELAFDLDEAQREILEEGAKVLMRIDRVGVSGLSEFRGTIASLDNGRAVATVDTSSAPGNSLDWLGLGQAVDRGEPFRALVLVRSRRLLSLIVVR